MDTAVPSKGGTGQLQRSSLSKGIFTVVSIQSVEGAALTCASEYTTPLGLSLGRGLRFGSCHCCHLPISSSYLPISCPVAFLFHSPPSLPCFSFPSCFASPSSSTNLPASLCPGGAASVHTQCAHSRLHSGSVNHHMLLRFFMTAIHQLVLMDAHSTSREANRIGLPECEGTSSKSTSVKSFVCCRLDWVGVSWESVAIKQILVRTEKKLCGEVRCSCTGNFLEIPRA